MANQTAAKAQETAAGPLITTKTNKQTNTVAFSPQGNSTEWPPLVGELDVNFTGRRDSPGQGDGSLRSLILIILDRSRYLFN
jgi:hypothetical protein